MSWWSSSINCRKTRSSKTATRIHCAVVRKSRNDDGNANSPHLKEMAGVNCISKNYMVGACSNKRKTNSSIPFLPEGIIFNILVWLPAEILYNVMRYVCREWYNIINDPDFINAHLLRSTTGLFMRSFFGYGKYSVHFVEMGRCDVQITESRFQLPVEVLASRNGLVLFRGRMKKKIFYVANPVTKQQVTLPLLPMPINPTRFGLAYAPSNREYKVVHASVSYRDKNNKFYCLILSVGADTPWRLIDIKHISQTAQLAFYAPPFSIGAFIYWACSSVPSVLALDVEAEIMYQYPVPQGYEGKQASYVGMGSFLSLIDVQTELLWQVWALTESKTGEWTKLFNIDFTSQRCMFEQMLHSQKCIPWLRNGALTLFPIAWLRNGEVLIFRVPPPSKAYVVYYVKTGKFSSFKSDPNVRYFAHVNSLVLLNVC